MGFAALHAFNASLSQDALNNVSRERKRRTHLMAMDVYCTYAFAHVREENHISRLASRELA